MLRTAVPSGSPFALGENSTIGGSIRGHLSLSVGCTICSTRTPDLSPRFGPDLPQTHSLSNPSAPALEIDPWSAARIQRKESKTLFTSGCNKFSANSRVYLQLSRGAWLLCRFYTHRWTDQISDILILTKNSNKPICVAKDLIICWDKVSSH